MTPPPIVSYNNSGISVQPVPACQGTATRSTTCSVPLHVPLGDPTRDRSLVGAQRVVIGTDGKAYLRPDPNYTLLPGERNPTSAELERVYAQMHAIENGQYSPANLIPNWTGLPGYTQIHSSATSGSNALTEQEFNRVVAIGINSLRLPADSRATAIQTAVSSVVSGDRKTATARAVATTISQLAETHLARALGGTENPLSSTDLQQALLRHGATGPTGGVQAVIGRSRDGETGQPAWIVFSDGRSGAVCSAQGIGGSQPLGMSLRDDQILTLLELGGIETGEYCMSPQRSGVVRLLSSFSQGGNANRIRNLISTLTGIAPNSIRADHQIVASDITREGTYNPYFTNAETLQIANSLRTFIQPQLAVDDARTDQLGMQRTGLDAQLEAAGLAKYSLYFMVGLSATMLFQTYAMAKQQGWTRGLDSFLSNTRTALKATWGRLRHRDGRAVWQHWRNIFQDSSPIIRDRTADFRTRSTPLSPTGREILRGFNRGSMPHVILGGPSGSGKGHGVTTAAIAAVQGNSGVQAFEGRNVRYVQISASRVVQQAGSWMNGAQTIFFRTLDGLAGEHPVIVHLTEADRFLEAGMGPGNQPLNLIAQMYEILEGKDPRYENLHFIFDSTRFDEIERKAPDLLRRTELVEVVPMTPQEVRGVFDHAIRDRLGGAEGRINRLRYERVDITDGAKDALTALGASERGAPPSAHINLMDAVVTNMTQGHDRSDIQITAEDVVRVVSERTGHSVESVQRELTQLLEGGIENNRRIQDRILDAFYEAYREPAGGRIDPLNPQGEHRGGYRDPGSGPRADAPVAPSAQPGGGNGANGSGNGATPVVSNGANGSAGRLEGDRGVVQEIVQTAAQDLLRTRTNGNSVTFEPGAIEHLASIYHGRGRELGTLADQQREITTILTRAADRSIENGGGGIVTPRDLTLEFRAHEAVENFISEHRTDASFAQLWDANPSATDRETLRKRFADAYIDAVLTSGGDRLTSTRSAEVISAHVQALGGNGGAHVVAASSHTPVVTPTPEPAPTPELSVEDRLAARERRLDQLIRAEIPNYDSLPAEARLSITESLPRLRADIIGRWRSQPLLRDGRSFEDPIPRDFIRASLESARPHHTWMDTHLPTERRRDERRRGR